MPLYDIIIDAASLHFLIFSMPLISLFAIYLFRFSISDFR